ncbi:hypothetical protein [Azospirillum palustre]|nr:hypothetical protein [Azospirillum palustre]
MFAELEQRSLDADFDEAFPLNDSFAKWVKGEREYWYYNGHNPDAESGGKRYQKYAGPVDNPDINARVERCRRRGAIRAKPS